MQVVNELTVPNLVLSGSIVVASGVSLTVSTSGSIDGSTIS